MEEIVFSLSARIKEAMAHKAPLAVRGGNTKVFYGGANVGDILDVRPYTGYHRVRTQGTCIDRAGRNYIGGNRVGHG